MDGLYNAFKECMRVCVWQKEIEKKEAVVHPDSHQCVDVHLRRGIGSPDPAETLDQGLGVTYTLESLNTAALCDAPQGLPRRWH